MERGNMDISIDTPPLDKELNQQLIGLRIHNVVGSLVCLTWNKAYELGCKDTLKKVESLLDNKA
jgi:hypothetical protein